MDLISSSHKVHPMGNQFNTDNLFNMDNQLMDKQGHLEMQDITVNSNLL